MYIIDPLPNNEKILTARNTDAGNSLVGFLASYCVQNSEMTSDHRILLANYVDPLQLNHQHMILS